ncbi:MAG: ABC transporter substrate-binding protein [Opitutales bacterium]|nr:ABC transporter substrate-binding protein [Opitutales bacterium]
MFKKLKQLWLGLLLIAASSSVLLYSDLDHRKSAPTPQAGTLPKIAIMQIVSTHVLDETVKGIVDGLRQNGYENGRTAQIKFFNASGDYSTASTISKDLAAAGYDIVITAGTPTMQSFAAANRKGETVHVFGAVTDPYGSGVGISGPLPEEHPPHMVGIGTFQPVENAFRIARQMNPELKTVGTIWNPGEHNSEACVAKAREICKELGIELFEANANNSSEVPEALRSILSRDLDAIWIGGDTVVNAANSNIIDTSAQSGVPVFTNDPSDAKNGAIFCLGASYQEVGLTVARMASRVLKGDSPSSMRVDNVVPERLAINEDTLTSFADKWTLNAELAKRAASSGQSSSNIAQAPEPGRMYKVGILYYVPHTIFTDAIEGIKETLAEAGFVEGKNLTLSISHANGDMSIMQQSVANMAYSDLDLIIPLSTPCLAAVCAKVKDKPVVFADVTEPIGAGAGKSFTDHQSNITGAVWPAPLEGGFDWMQRLFPNIRRMGVLYNPGEPNAITEITLAKKYTKVRGIELITRPVNNSSEVPEALTSIFSEDLDAFFLEADNAVISAQPIIGEACRKNGIPLLGDDDSCMGYGALLAVGISPHGNGRLAGQMASRVLLGEDPATMPFAPSEEVLLSIDLKVAQNLGITLPSDMLKEAHIFHNLNARLGRPAKIAIVNMADNPALNAAQAGVVIGMKKCGLVEGKDFTVRYYNAQGEFANISQTLDAAINSGPDIIVPIGTPTTQTLASKNYPMPAVFTVSSNPKDIGIEEVIAKGAITGAYEEPPIRELLDFARKEIPGISRIGIIYTPSEINSVIAYEKLKAECERDGITLISEGVSSVNDLSDAAHSLIRKDVQAILTSADNLMSTSLAPVLKATQPAGIPIIGNDLELVKLGAQSCIGHSYEQWGIESGIMVVKVLAGVPMTELPPQALSNESLRVIRNENSKPTAAAVVPVPPARAKPFELRIVAYNDTAFTEDCYRGLVDAIRASGMVEGKDYKLRYMNAQGDMSTLSSIMNSVRADEVDVLMCITTPVLQSALRQVTDTNIVFTGVGDGVQAGAGKSETDHLPNVTGITTRSPFDGMAEIIASTIPNAKRVGTLFTPAEINSVLYKDWFAEALAKRGIELVAVPVTSSADTTEAASILCQKNIDAVCQILDNTTRPGFAGIVRKADEAAIPTFCFERSQLKDGSVLALARDYYDAGYEAGEIALRVIHGESPANIPFRNTSSEALIINRPVLEKYNLTLSEELEQRAAKDAAKRSAE